MPGQQKSDSSEPGEKCSSTVWVQQCSDARCCFLETIGSMVWAMAKMRVPMPELAMPELPMPELPMPHLPMPKVADVQTAKQ
jgi:hypothetical protein